MKPTPKGWPRLSAAIFYDDAAGAIDWLCRAFGFEVRLKVEGDRGRIEHSELVYGEAVVMVATSGDRPRHPEFPRACAAGATVVEEPAVHDYGADHWADRSYGALDPEGHLWWFTERLRNPPGE